MGEANRSGSNLYLWTGRAKAEVVQLCFWHQKTRAGFGWRWGEAEVEVIPVCLGVQPKEEGLGLWLTSGRSSPFDLTQ